MSSPAAFAWSLTALNFPLRPVLADNQLACHVLLGRNAGNPSSMRTVLFGRPYFAVYHEVFLAAQHAL